MPPSALALGLLIVASSLDADTVVLVNGDRVSGTIVASGTRRIRLKTPYGLLVIPRTEIERLVHDDGREEVLNPPADPTPPPPPVVPLQLVVTGDTFWQAWDPPSAPVDPSLRLALAMDGREVATYLDAILDPEDLPGAVVNSFVFAPESLVVRPAAGVRASPPAPAAGEIRLAVELPAALAGGRRLTLAYQVNDAESTAPVWRTVLQAEVDVVLSLEEPTRVRLKQDRGRMRYTRGTLRDVETFRAVARTSGAP